MLDICISVTNKLCMPATTPLRHPKECRRRKCNNGEIPHATLRKSICIFEEKVLAKNTLKLMHRLRYAQIAIFPKGACWFGTKYFDIKRRPFGSESGAVVLRPYIQTAGRVSIPGVALLNTYQWLIIDICVEQNLCNIFIFA